MSGHTYDIFDRGVYFIKLVILKPSAHPLPPTPKKILARPYFVYDYDI